MLYRALGVVQGRARTDLRDCLDVRPLQPLSGALSAEAEKSTRSSQVISNVSSWPILLKKSMNVANQIFFASWKRFRNWDAGGPMAERRRDVGRPSHCHYANAH